MKRAYYLIMTCCLIIVLLFLASCSKSQKVVFSGSIVAQDSVLEANFGTVVLSLSSSAYSLDVKKVEVLISKITFSGSKGFENIVATPAIYDLVKLRNEQSRNSYLGQAMIKKDLYTSIVLTIEKILVDDKEVFVPKKEFSLPLNLNLKPNTVNLVELKFLIDDSLRKTLASEYIFAPVVELTSSLLDSIEVGNDKSVAYKKEKTFSDSKYGMTITGLMVPGVGIWATAPLRIENNKLKIVDVEKKETPIELQLPPQRIIKATLYNFALNPLRIELLKDEKVVLKISSGDKRYGLKIEDLDADFLLTPEKNLEFEISFEESGTHSIICVYPCYGREGRVLGQIVVVKRI